MATPSRTFSVGGGSSIHDGSSYKGTSGSRTAGSNPFRSHIGSAARGASMGSQSASGRVLLRDNTPSFADCFSGMESQYLALGESPGAQSPTPMRRRHHSPIPGHDGPPLSGQHLSQQGQMPTTSHVQLSAISGTGYGAGDFSYNSLQLSTDGSQPPGTPPPRLEKEGYSSTMAGGMFGPGYGSSTVKKGQPDSQLATPLRPPLYPNISPIPGPGVGANYMSPIHQQRSKAGGNTPTSVADAVAAGFVSPGHGKSAAVVHTEYRLFHAQDDAHAGPVSLSQLVASAGAEQQGQAGSLHQDTPEVTQENFQRSMREAEEEALALSQVSGQHVATTQGGAAPGRSGSGGSAGLASTEMGTHTAAPSTEPAPQAPLGGSQGKIPTGMTGGNSSSSGGGGLNLGASVEQFLVSATEEQRIAMIALLTELNKSPGAPSSRAGVLPLSSGSASPEATAWQSIGTNSQGAAADLYASNLFPSDPMSKIAPDFGYYEPTSSTLFTASSGVGLGSPNRSSSLLPKRWQHEYHNALMTSSTPPYRDGSSLPTRSGSIHPVSSADLLSSPFGTSSPRRMRL